MDRRRCIGLYKSEWERLKKQAGVVETPEEDTHEEERSKYVRALNEQSRKWTKNWPDSTEGVVCAVKKRKERQRARDLAFIESYREKERKKIDNSETIKEAKQKLFNTTGYGKQLISALLKSKEIEELDAQIEFKKVIREHIIKQENDLDSKIAAMENNLYDFSKKQEKEKGQREQTTKENAKINKIIHTMNVLEISKANEVEKQFELEDALMMKQLLEYEAHEKDQCNEEHRKAVKQYELEQKVIQERRQEVEQLDDALHEVARKYQDIRRCREETMLKNAVLSRSEADAPKRNYENLRNIQEKELKMYDDFIMKGIEKAEKRKLQEEKTQEEKQNKSKAELLEIAKSNRAAAEDNDWKKHCNKCYCDRQGLFNKPNKKNMKNISGSEKKESYKPESFLTPNNKLSEQLKERQKEPTPWNSLKGENEYFMQQANVIQEECKHKNMAEKVINDYKKVNMLNKEPSLKEPNASFDEDASATATPKECEWKEVDVFCIRRGKL